MRLLRRLLVGFLATLGGLLVVIVVVGGFLAWRFAPHAPELPDRILLTADWRGALSETAGPPNLLEFELQPSPTVSEVVLALDAAAADERVAGLMVLLADTANGLAVTQELRDAVGRFRAAGKFAIAYADTFGEVGAGTEGYYLASAFDRIDLQPVGVVGLTALGAEVPLARDLLDRLGVRMEVVRREEYKTALESLTSSELSGPNREQISALLDSLTGQLAAGIAQGRSLTPEQVIRRITTGPYSGKDAMAAGLIDRVRPRRDTYGAALQQAGEGAVGIDLDDYAAALGQPDDPAATVALVRSAGLIRRGGGSLADGIAADSLVDMLREIEDEPAIGAVILRLDSGGGSAVASETIREAVERVHASGRPVIVSMSNTAASGGYWIAAGADRIVAHPATITGSIGVVAGKPVLEEAWRMLGVGWGTVATGENAGMWSVNRPFTAGERDRVERLVGSLYDQFVTIVSNGRALSPDKVREIAKGRVWVGETALGLGLVDELGGLDVAMAAARRSLQLPSEAKLAIDLWPREENPLLQLARALSPIAVKAQAALALLRAALGGTAASLPLAVR